MECKNVFCVYCHHEKCILSAIQLDIQARCEECLLITVEDEYLEQKKIETLNKLKASWNDNLKEE